MNPPDTTPRQERHTIDPVAIIEADSVTIADLRARVAALEADRKRLREALAFELAENQKLNQLSTFEGFKYFAVRQERRIQAALAASEAQGGSQ